MAGFDVLVIGAAVPVLLACWAHSRWRAHPVLRKLSGKGKKARKKALKRLSESERLVVERHNLLVLKLFALAFSFAVGGALVHGTIGFEANLIVFHWSGDVTPSQHPIGFWVLWLVASLFPIGLWALYVRERKAFDERARSRR